MTPRPSHADLAGSRYLALQRLARAQKRTTAELLQLYVLESFLRRLVRSRHDNRLVLKGGMLLAAFDLRRATRDVDVLALQADNDPAAVQRMMADVASVEVDDGVEFLQGTLTVGVIRDDDVYPGVRASLEARLATARIKFSVDFNVGDPVAQRIVVRAHVTGLARDEIAPYLAHRLRLAGTELPLFEPAAQEAIFQGASGLPRKVNSLAHHSLFAAAIARAKTVNTEHVQAALKEVA